MSLVYKKHEGDCILGGRETARSWGTGAVAQSTDIFEHECYRRCEDKSLGGWFGSGSGAFWIVFLSSFKPHMESELWVSRKS